MPGQLDLHLIAALELHARGSSSVLVEQLQQVGRGMPLQLPQRCLPPGADIVLHIRPPHVLPEGLAGSQSLDDGQHGLPPAGATCAGPLQRPIDSHVQGHGLGVLVRLGPLEGCLCCLPDGLADLGAGNALHTAGGLAFGGCHECMQRSLLTSTGHGFPDGILWELLQQSRGQQ
jgi:hypothetical protein